MEDKIINEIEAEDSINNYPTEITDKLIKSIKGIKHDQEKLDYTLLIPEFIEELMRVLMFGMNKYGRFNWKLLENKKERYLAAAFRHLVAVLKNEELDEESGLTHIGHLTSCLMFIYWDKYINTDNVVKEKQ